MSRLSNPRSFIRDQGDLYYPISLRSISPSQSVLEGLVTQYSSCGERELWLNHGYWGRSSRARMLSDACWTRLEYDVLRVTCVISIHQALQSAYSAYLQQFGCEVEGCRRETEMNWSVRNGMSPIRGPAMAVSASINFKQTFIISIIHLTPPDALTSALEVFQSIPDLHQRTKILDWRQIQDVQWQTERINSAAEASRPTTGKTTASHPFSLSSISKSCIASAVRGINCRVHHGPSSWPSRRSIKHPASDHGARCLASSYPARCSAARGNHPFDHRSAEPPN